MSAEVDVAAAWERLLPEMRGYLRKRAAFCDAEDLLQDVALTVWMNRERTFASPAHFRNWVYLLLRWRLCAYYEKKQDVLPLGEALPARAGEPLEELVRAERSACLRRALAALPRRQRWVLAARYVLRFPYARIAKSLGISPVFARVCGCRALKRLRMDDGVLS
ncbi:MAG: sigma-70 family RNA polymerase sigma factor [Eubacteriales bacterium]|nr:sigma-70 family RNA polymerase sigma factor [Eubacteriales bacterium]